MARTISKSIKNPQYYLNKLNPKTGKFYTEDEARFEAAATSPFCIEYWIKQGFDNEEAQRELDKHKESVNKKTQSKRKHKNSPMVVATWLQKINPDTGKFYTEEEAKYKIKTFRKSNLEYWLSRGCSHEEAELKRSEFQKSASKRGHETIKDKSWLRPTNVDYWLNKGFSIEEANQKVTERQSTFSLEKCISQYGEELGRARWEERQQKWLKSINDRPQDEWEDIQKSKLPFKRFFNPDAVRDHEFFMQWKKMCESRDMLFFDNWDDASKAIVECFDQMGFYKGDPFEYFIDKVCPKYYYMIFNKTKGDVYHLLHHLLKDMALCDTSGAYVVRNFYCSHRMDTEIGTLLSLGEIFFYDVCKQIGIKISSSNKQYPHSSLRYDFKVGNYYIEIAGLMNIESYRQKMIYKRETFGSIILFDQKDIQNFIQKVLKEKDAQAIRYYTSRPL